ncbi:MAG: hypothetical protein V4733_10470 [Verrucomicrobiota bacterium]
MQTNQEKYSIDEIMARLKQGNGDTPAGELVTREDGSQAIRVRKRKRRSEQQQGMRTPEASSRMRIIQVSAALGLVILALIVCGSAIVYSNSSSFRKHLADQIATATGANAELRQFRMNPTGANASSLTLQWPEGNLLSSLRLTGLHATTHPASFLGSSFAGDEVTAREGVLELHPPGEGELRFKPAADPAVDFRRYTIRNLKATLPGGANGPIRLNQADASFYPRHSSGKPQLIVARGDLLIPHWPPLKLNRGHIEFHNRQIEIVNLGLYHESDRNGTLSLSGTFSPYDAGGTSNLAVKLEQFPIVHLLGGQFDNMVAGAVNTTTSAESNYFSFTNSPTPSSSLAVSFANSLDSGLTLKGLPVFHSLRELIDDPWFDAPVFETQAKGELRRANGNVTLGDLHLVAKGRMILRGNITVSRGGVMSGQLRIGIADPVIGASPSAGLLETLFVLANDDFRWLTLNITGTTASPADSFRKLLEEAKIRAISANQPATSPMPAAEPTPQAPASPPSFEDLTAPR